MLLSIIVPNYNLPQELLKRCIDSILALEISAEEYEVIIVDDGSETPPRWIATAYPLANITLIECNHIGPGAARNSGIDAAKGRYILFLDGDDTLHKSNAMKQCTDKLKAETPDILRYNSKTIPHATNTNNSTHQKVHFSNTISGAVYMIANNLPGSGCCYFIRKEFIDNKGIRFTPNIYHEDDEFTTKAHYHAQKFITSDAHIYNYHTRAGSITRSQAPADIAKREKDSLTVIKNLCTFRTITHERSNSLQKRALQRKLTMLVVDFIINQLYAGKKAKEIHITCRKNFTEQKLYPLAKHSYGIKYAIFRRLANSLIGLRILRLLIPTRHKPTEQ